MKKLAVALIALQLLTPSLSMAAGPYKEEDFKWDPLTNFYKRIIVAGVNKIAREKPEECAKMDLTNIQRSGGTPDDPEFEVICGEGDKITHAHFSKTDVTGDPASDIPLEE